MLRVGIVGKGYFGKKLYDKLSSFTEVVFFTGRELDIDHEVDWVVIASSTDSHYELCKTFLNKGVNVFVEKPMTLSYKHSKELVELSKKVGVRFYVDDVFLWHPMTKTLENTQISDLEFHWNKYGSFTDNVFNNLAYHDLYLALHLNGNLDGDVKVELNRVNEKVFWVGDTKFSYNRISDTKQKYVVNGGEVYDYATPQDPLELMLRGVFSEEVDFDQNLNMSLEVHKVLDKLNEHKPKVAVVGGGIFGVSSALKLCDLDVTLFERNSDILSEASATNQYRLHRGYHYPRSIDTAISANKGTQTFVEEYPCEIPQTKQYYAIASKNSKVSTEDYESFMKEVSLNYDVVDLDLVSDINVDKVYLANETLFDPCELYKICKDRLDESDVELRLNTEFTPSMVDSYDYVVNCTYSNLNQINDDNQVYQFEVCEKPLLKLSDKYKGIGIVVMDGPFMCIDPYSDTDYHIMGNVVHAIHETNVGEYPIVSDELKSVLNKGLVRNPKVTNIDKFIESASEFFDMEGVEHIGSMFTIRTVLANRDHDDARPSIVKKHNQKLYSIFSGKISTAVDTSSELERYIMNS